MNYELKFVYFLTHVGWAFSCRLGWFHMGWAEIEMGPQMLYMNFRPKTDVVFFTGVFVFLTKSKTYEILRVVR